MVALFISYDLRFATLVMALLSPETAMGYGVKDTTRVVYGVVGCVLSNITGFGKLAVLYRRCPTSRSRCGHWENGRGVSMR